MTGLPSTSGPAVWILVIDWDAGVEDPVDTNGDGVPDAGCDDSLDLSIDSEDGWYQWNVGLVDSARTWVGEACGADHASCHPADSWLMLAQVPDCDRASVVLGETTGFAASDASELTYFVEAANFDGAVPCFVAGADPSYYGALGCIVLE